MGGLSKALVLKKHHVTVVYLPFPNAVNEVTEVTMRSHSFEPLQMKTWKIVKCVTARGWIVQIPHY